MKVKITYKCPIGPVESDPIEFTIIEDITTEEYIQKLNNPDSIIKIEVL
jgi:hypothetical protein